MIVSRLFLGLGGLLLACLPSLQARDFSVAVYNVENLFDADGKAAYDDYKPELYTPAHLATKIRNIAEVIARMTPDGGGPDVLLFCEIEADQTPFSQTHSVRELVDSCADEAAHQLLSKPLPDALADWPAEAWLLKALEDRGLKGYTVVVGSDGQGASSAFKGQRPSIKNVILTRFPVLEVHNHPCEGARNILEVHVEVDGHRLILLNNHWKSGASDPKTEAVRVSNAKTLRKRLDAILQMNPLADVLIGGDFNSQYNQKALYGSRMGTTGINDILRSQGDEAALLKGGADLYNLWYELPVDQRGSDTYRGEWGTLMQLLVTPGLRNRDGVHYVDNSFRVVRIDGLNTTYVGTPLRWTNAGAAGSGTSDHFPVIASFSTEGARSGAAWLTPASPSTGETPDKPVRIDYNPLLFSKNIIPLSKEPASTNLRDGSHNGKVFLVDAEVSSATNPKHLIVKVRGALYDIYCPEGRLRDLLRKRWDMGKKVRFVGELGMYRERWQFVIHDPSWILKSD